MKITSKVLAFALAAVMLFVVFTPSMSALAHDMGKVGSCQTISPSDGLSTAVKSDGSLWVWGANWNGQFGNGTKDDLHTFHASPIKTIDNVASVSTGNLFSVAIKTDGSLWGWGSNSYGVLGDDRYTSIPTPKKIMDDAAAVSAGYAHVLAIKTDGSLWAWGSDVSGQLGSGMEYYKTPDNAWVKYSIDPVKIMDGVAAVSAGDSYSMAIKTDGSLWAWGSNSYGQLGDGTTTKWGQNVYDIIEDHGKATPVKIMDNVAAICAGGSYSMAIKTDGSLWAWGSNLDGQLGDGTVTKRNETGDIIEDHNANRPVKIMDNVASVSAGFSHTIAVKTDGSLWAWGDGYLGNGTNPYLGIETGSPSPLKIMDNVAAASAGGSHSMAIKTDGSLWAWGMNENGKLGDGTSSTTYKYDPDFEWISLDILENNRFSPVKIMDGVKLPAGAAIPTTPPPASDKPSSWAQADVTVAVTAGLVPSSLQAKYTQATTRAEFCALAVALYENVTRKEITVRTTFNDTSDVDVQKMGALGVVTGVGNDNFAPNQKLTREQAATMLSRLADAVGKPLASSAASFADNGSISSWAIEGVGQVQASGIMGGVGSNTFSPKTDYTWEQSIVTMLRLYNAVK